MDEFMYQIKKFWPRKRRYQIMLVAVALIVVLVAIDILTS